MSKYQRHHQTLHAVICNEPMLLILVHMLSESSVVIAKLHCINSLFNPNWHKGWNFLKARKLVSCSVAASEIQIPQDCEYADGRK